MIGLKKQQEKTTPTADPTLDQNDLEEGDVICNECKGSGVKPSRLNPQELASICPKCNGRGKLDWISNAMGKPPQEPKHYGTSGYALSGNISSSGYACCMPVYPSVGTFIKENNVLKVFDGTEWRSVV